MSKTVLKEVIRDERYESEDGFYVFVRSYDTPMVDEEGNYLVTNGHWVFYSGGEAFGIGMNRNDLAEMFHFDLEPM